MPARRSRKLAGTRSEPRTGPRPADFVLVGGVPGAGKSTAMAAAAPDLVETLILDPDQAHDWLATRLPHSVPYRLYRPLCHVWHAVVVLGYLLAGPRRPWLRSRRAGGRRRRLLVHDPSTRPGRLRFLRSVARLRGWTPLLIYVDTPTARARADQFRRGRVLDAARFDAHCQRWAQLRDEARTGSCAGWPTILTPRSEAALTMRQALAGVRPIPSHFAGSVEGRIVSGPAR